MPPKLRSDPRSGKRTTRAGRRSRSERSASSARTGSSTSTTRTPRRCGGSCPSAARSVRAGSRAIARSTSATSRPRSRMPARWPCCRTRPDEDDPAEARQQARRPRGRRGRRRRLCAQLPDAAWARRAGHQGRRQARREPEARSLDPCERREGRGRAGGSASRRHRQSPLPRTPARKDGCSAASRRAMSPRPSRRRPAFGSTGMMSTWRNRSARWARTRCASTCSPRSIR